MKKMVFAVVVVFCLLGPSFIGADIVTGEHNKDFVNNARPSNIHIKTYPRYVIYPDEFDVIVSLDDLGFRFIRNFYIYIMFEPKEPANIVEKLLCRTPIGKSEFIPVSSLKPGGEYTIKCTVSLLQSFNDGYISAKIVPAFNDRHPLLHLVFLNFINLRGGRSDQMPLTLYSFNEIPAYIGVVNYSFTCCVA